MAKLAAPRHGTTSETLAFGDLAIENATVVIHLDLACEAMVVNAP